MEDSAALKAAARALLTFAQSVTATMAAEGDSGMSGADKDINEIRDDIRALSGGEAVQPRKEAEMPRVRYKAWLLVLPAALFAFLLYVALSRWLGLPTETLGDFAMLMSLLLMPDFVGESRPANRRHWATLAAAVLVAALAAAVTAVGVVWLLARAAPDFTGGFLAVLAILGIGLDQRR